MYAEECAGIVDVLFKSVAQDDEEQGEVEHASDKYEDKDDDGDGKECGAGQNTERSVMGGKEGEGRGVKGEVNTRMWCSYLRWMTGTTLVETAMNNQLIREGSDVV